MKVKVKIYLSRVAHSAQSLLSIGALYRQHQQNQKNKEHTPFMNNRQLEEVQEIRNSKT